MSFLAYKKKALGFGKFIGNKGGLITYFKYKQTSFAFLNSHLKSGVKNIKIRNQNYSELFRRFQIGDFTITHRFDYLFWFGDLNYRVENGWKETVNLIEKAKLDEIKLFC